MSVTSPRAFDPSVTPDRTSALSRLYRPRIACVIALCLMTAATVHASENQSESLQELLKQPGVLFARELADIPGKNLVVVTLEFPPNSPDQSKSPQRDAGHRHPGSVYVYVVKGTVRLGIDGEPVQVVHAGGSFFEPAGAIHTVAENASATEPASAIAVLIVPDGAPIATAVEDSASRE